MLRGFARPALELWKAMLDACDKRFPEAFQNFVDKEGNGDVIKIRDQCMATSEDEFQVLVHGDAWFNNILFK